MMKRHAVLACAALAAVLAVSSSAAAQNMGVIRWRGFVDRDTTVLFRGDRAERVQWDSADDRVSASDPLPAEEVTVYVRPLRGRALVSVDGQPERASRYTASVYVVSDRRSPEEVEFELLWVRDRPTRGGSRDEGTYGRGYGRAEERDPPPTGGWGRPEEREESRLGRSGRPVDVFRWRGVVDGSDNIDLKADSVIVRHLRNLPIQGMKYDLTSPLPEQPLEMELTKLEGRGKVRLVAEPSASNDWTATVLVDDTDQGGAETYVFELRWERPRGIRVGSQGRPQETLRWSGYVDGRSVLVVHGREIGIEHQTGRPVRGEKAEATGPLPARPVVVNLRKIDGRGQVRIEQQPAAANDFTLRVLVDDPKSSDDFYRIELTWER